MAGFLFLLLLELLNLGTNHRAAVTLFRIRAVVILVVALGIVEFFQRHDLGDDFIREIFMRDGFGFLRNFFLPG